MDVYRIAKWSEVFERAESRKLKSVSWVSWPVDLDSRGYDSMIEHFGDDVPAIYGAWAALICVAARCPQRGTLAYSNAKPMPLARIAEKARMPLGVMQRMWDWAVSEDVAWIELACCPGESPDIPAESPGYIDRQDRQLPNGRTDERACVRACGRGLIVISRDEWRSMRPTLERIARVVTRNENILESRLRDGDRDLCGLAATLAHRVFDDDWLSAILRGMQNRKKPPDNPWGFFRTSLIKACEKRGEKLHDLEECVRLPSRVKAVTEKTS